MGTGNRRDPRGVRRDWYAALARAQAIDVTAVLVFGQIVTSVLAAGVEGVPIRPDLTGLALIAIGVGAATVGTLRARGR